MTESAEIVVATPRQTPHGFDRPRARRIPDACRAIGISRSHLYALAAKGQIRLIHIGGRTVVPETEIDRLIEGA